MTGHYIRLERRSDGLSCDSVGPHDTDVNCLGAKPVAEYHVRGLIDVDLDRVEGELPFNLRKSTSARRKNRGECHETSHGRTRKGDRSFIGQFLEHSKSS